MFKIYKIIDNTNDNVYIGITKQKIIRRICQHECDYKGNRNVSSSLIIKNNDWKYELIEETDDKTRERYWINNTPNCINTKRLNFDHSEYSKIKYQKTKHITKESRNNYNLKVFHWKKSWGGDQRYDNNLLKIDINLFIQNHN